jgi:hypothetical protein
MRPQGLRSSCALVALMVLAVASTGCGRAAAGAHTPDESPLEWRAPLTLPPPDVHTFPEFDPLTIRARPAGYAALDRVTQQLVLFDTALRITARTARRGGGPGELDGVLRLVSWRGGLAVGEGRNRRISLFSADGTFRGIARAPYRGTPFAIRDDRWFAAATSADAALLEMSRLDSPDRTLVGQRPAVVDPSDARHIGQDLLVFRPDGSALLLENRSGQLVSVRDDGTMTERWMLPEPFLASMRSRRAQRVAAVETLSGGRVHAAPLFKDLAHVGGSVVILQPLAPHCVLLVSLFSATVTPLVGGTEAINDAACRAESVALTPSELVLAVNDSLLRFPSPFSLSLARR